MKDIFINICFCTLVLSCSQKESNLTSILKIVDHIKAYRSLDSSPDLILDGFNINYAILKENSDLINKENIGFFKYLTPEQSEVKYKGEFDKGVVILTSNLWLPKENEARSIIYMLNNKEIDFKEYLSIDLERVKKKGIIEGKENIKNAFSINGDMLIYILTE